MEKKRKTIGGGELTGTRGTDEQGNRAYEYQQEIEREHKERMKYIEEQLNDNRGLMGRK
jgi:hypothetical protein